MERKMEHVIQANNIHKSFGEGTNRIDVLRGINFEIKKGEFVSIMGPSGCGKSTLLYIIGGLDDPEKGGQILLNGTDIHTLRDREKSRIRRTQTGFVFQFYNLVQNLTVEENILLPVVMNGKKASAYKKDLDEILEIAGIADKRNVIPSKLSGGQQQRVSVARAMIASPDIILADEPIGNLDSHSGEEIMRLFKRINCEKRITILQVTHSLSAAHFGDRIIYLKDGEIEKDEMLIKE